MPIGGEKAAVQNPFLRYAEEAGWTYLAPEEALDFRRGVTTRLSEYLNAGLQNLELAKKVSGAFTQVFEEIGGAEWLRDFAKNHEVEFFKALTKLLPRETLKSFTNLEAFIEQASATQQPITIVIPEDIADSYAASLKEEKASAP